MKKYFLTIILVLLVIIGLFLVLKDKKVNKALNFPSVDNKITTDDSVTNYEEISVEQGLTLEVNSPDDKDVVNTTTVQVIGKTSPNAEVFVNEKELKADSNGNFSVSYELYEGENNIFVAVNDDMGNYAEKSITVYLETAE